MYKFFVLCTLYITLFAFPLKERRTGEAERKLISNLVEYLGFLNLTHIRDLNLSKNCINNLIKYLKGDDASYYFEKLYFGSSFNKNDINTYSTCINYNGDENKDSVYLTVLINEKISLYDDLTISQGSSGYVFGLCIIDGCTIDEYEKLILYIMKSVIYTEHNLNPDTNITSNIINPINDIKIYKYELHDTSFTFITFLRYLPFIIIVIHIIFVLINKIPIFLAHLFLLIFCCKKNKFKKIKSRSDTKNTNKSSPTKDKLQNNNGNNRSNDEVLEKSLNLLYNIENNFTSLISYKKQSRIISNSGLAYINGLKGIFLIFFLFGNVYSAIYSSYVFEKNKNNFFFQIKNIFFVFFYVGIKFAPKMLLCASGFTLFYKFVGYLDGKIETEEEMIKQNDEDSNKRNNSSSNSNDFYARMHQKNKNKPNLSFKYLYIFYIKQINKYIICLLFFCFFIFSFNNVIILFRGETSIWNFFNLNMISSSIKGKYLLPLLIGLKTHLIPGISNNDSINILDYFYLPFQEILYFLITSFIIFLGYRNNYHIDRFFKIIAFIIFIYRIVYYYLNDLDDKDYFTLNKFGKFYNSILYNYNFYIIGIIFGMINYAIQKGYVEREYEIQNRIYLFSTTKLLNNINRKKIKLLNVLSIISGIILIFIIFFQQIIASFYDIQKDKTLSDYKSNIFSEIILLFDADIFAVGFNLLSLCQYIKTENRLNNLLCHNFWSIFDRFYFSFILIINPVILYIIYTIDSKLIFNLSNCFLFSFICGFLVINISILIHITFEYPLKKLFHYLIKLYENDEMNERLSTIDINPEENLLDNVTASITDIIDEEEG